MRYLLREAIANHLSAWRGLNCRPQQVLITSGACGALEIIFCRILRGDRKVAIEDPGWRTVREVLGATKTEMFPICIDRKGFDAGRIPTGLSAAIVTPYRHYPTGVVMPLSRRAALLEWTVREHAMISEDDYDSEFRYIGRPLIALDGFDRTIYLGSFSKVFSPAMRFGNFILPLAQVQAAKDRVLQVKARASLIPQPALATFMQSEDFAIDLRYLRRICARRQAHKISALSRGKDLLHIAPDPSGMHFCAPLQPILRYRISDR